MFENLPLFPESASTISGEVDALYIFLVCVSLFFFLLIAITLIYFAVRFRRRSDEERPDAVHGSMILELTWTIIPLGIAMFIFVWGAVLYFKALRPPNAAIDIYVVGKQWMWKFQHTSGRREINELHVPVGKAVKLTLASEDVIHAFFVPAFRIKYDVVPGRYRTTWFQATKPGRYRLFCAEYCGTRHAGMIGHVYVMQPEDYQNWLSGGEAGLSLAAAGEKLFQGLGCVTCHRADTTGRGPQLDGLFGKQVKLQTGETITADENYIRESVVNPQAKLVAGYQPIMPTFQGLITEDGLMQIIAYIKSLSAKPTAPTAQEVLLKQP